jgi:hypothetical protein
MVNPILLQMLTLMGEDLEKLEKLPKTIADLDNRVSNLEKQPSTLEPNTDVSLKTPELLLIWFD